ncbi:MAG: hypothetical protein JWR19_3798 [Pedosphaera sp.]|nr:hypothetical protein [Pedosphaera sp.]
MNIHKFEVRSAECGIPKGNSHADPPSPRPRRDKTADGMARQGVRRWEKVHAESLWGPNQRKDLTQAQTRRPKRTATMKTQDFRSTGLVTRLQRLECGGVYLGLRSPGLALAQAITWRAFSPVRVLPPPSRIRRDKCRTGDHGDKANQGRLEPGQGKLR